MSGIAGIFHFDGAPVRRSTLVGMTSSMKSRGPDGMSIWLDGSVGLGFTLLATTPEAWSERLPLRHEVSGCVIVADARIDNRQELLRSLKVSGPDGAIGDGTLILSAYLAWGTACVNRLLGDFAFAIWNPRARELFCARDRFGLRPFYYHAMNGGTFAFASDQRAVLSVPEVPYRLNETRIADFLVPELEGIDYTSTYFTELHRLPPAHTMLVTPTGAHQRPYWVLDSRPELKLKSDSEYAEGFLHVFTQAVRNRLRGGDVVGSMLSGGMDSGSVVAVAARLTSEAGGPPFRTFSATAPDSSTCVETRTILAAQKLSGLEPRSIHYGELGQRLPRLAALTWDLGEPFDHDMTLPRVVDMAAQEGGVKVLLNGVSGDVVLSQGSCLARLLREGRWLSAYRAAVGWNAFFGGALPVWQNLHTSSRAAFVPAWLRRLRWQLDRGGRARQQAEGSIRNSMIKKEFAESVGLGDWLRTMAGQEASPALPSYQQERRDAMDQPYLTAAVERYDRVAASVGIEHRDPFLDLAVVDYSLSLPHSQRLSADGWPKVILRRAMDGFLPDEVRWRKGKQHLGWAFTSALMDLCRDRVRFDIEANRSTISKYVDVQAVDRCLRNVLPYRPVS